MTADPSPISFGLWNPPSALFRIKYSLPLFHEIEFFVGDGYRRIPHGGLEVGGLLYGTEEPAGLTLLAYQAIECQHLFGPSFVLSDADLEALRVQMAAPFHHASHGDLALVGWFISHGRGDLKLTERELELFDELLAGPRQVTMLVKPEKFKPTQYGFIVRPRRSRLTDPACHDTFLLPLSAKPNEQAAGSSSTSVRTVPSSRSGRVSPPPTAESVQSLPLPEEADAARRSGPAPDRHDLIPPVEPTAVPPAGVAVPPANNPLPRTDSVTPPTAVATPAAVAEGVPAKASVPPFATEKVANEATAQATATQVVQTARPDTVLKLTPAGEHDFVPFSGYGRRKLKVDEDRFEDIGDTPRWFEISLGAAILLLSMAGVIWTYLNFLLPPIPLQFAVIRGSKVVVWPAEMTDASEVALTVWTAGQPTQRPLTATEIRAGFALLPTLGPDSTVQLRMHHWAYNRSGQIRLIQVPPATPAPSGVPRRLRRSSFDSASSHEGAR